MTAAYLSLNLRHVALPSEGQSTYNLRIMYSIHPGDDVGLEVVGGSAIRAVGSQPSFATTTIGMTAGEWCCRRVRNSRRSLLKDLKKPLVINGVEVRECH